jgi:hypothetical protein
MKRERGRDPDGRPRQQRPRDALGRPLPFGTPGVEPVPEEPLPPLEALRCARELLEAGRPFAAHEVLEACWKAAPERERDLWQGLAQLCVGLTHAARGNAGGAARLVERGVGRLSGVVVDPAYVVSGLDTEQVIAWARAALVEVGLARTPQGWPQ